jgi:hypothetical protein
MGFGGKRGDGNVLGERWGSDGMGSMGCLPTYPPSFPTRDETRRDETRQDETTLHHSHPTLPFFFLFRFLFLFPATPIDVARQRHRQRQWQRLASYHVTSHHIASYCIVSYRIASYRIASHRIASHRIVSAQTRSHRSRRRRRIEIAIAIGGAVYFRECCVLCSSRGYTEGQVWGCAGGAGGAGYLWAGGLGSGSGGEGTVVM